MSWPTSDVNNTNTASASTAGQPAAYRADARDLITKFNQMRSHVSSFMQGLLNRATKELVRTDLGSTTVGDAVFVATTPAVARTALGSTAVGDALFIATSMNVARGALGLATTDSPTFSGLNGGQLAGMRNRIINGDMRIDQRNNGGAVTPTSTGYTLDRYMLAATQASKLTVQQVIDAPPGLMHSAKFTVASQFSPGASDRFYFSQRIEGYNVQDFGCGTAAPATVTVSLWVKGSVAGNYACAFYNGGGTRSYIGVIPVTTSWARQSITLVVDGSGTWPNTSGNGFSFALDLGSGSSAQGTASTWATGLLTRTSGSVTFVNQTAGATLQMTGLQVELGSAVTAFEQRPVGLELALCQRYYQTIGGYSMSDVTLTGYQTAGKGISQIIALPVPMRTIPTVVQPFTTNTNTTGLQIGAVSASDFVLYAVATVTGYVEAYNTSGGITCVAEL